MTQWVPDLREGRVEEKEWCVERVKQEGTRSGEVGVASLERVVKTRSIGVVSEEEIKVLEDGGVNGDG